MKFFGWLGSLFGRSRLDAMAKLANVWNKPIQEMSQFGDMVNTISNNTPAKASEIVEALGRIGGTAKSFGLSEQGAVSLTSAMIGLGKAPEVASRAVNHLLSTLATLDITDKSVSASLKQMGLDASEFGKLLKTDAEGALFTFIEAMNKLPKDEQIGFSVDMFGKNFYDDILALATAPELLTKIRSLLSDSTNYMGSMTKESAVLSATTEGQIQKFKNNITILKASIGTAFLPALTSIMDKLTPIIGAISAWANENPKLVTTITAITAGALALVATLGGLALAFTAVTSGIGSIIAIGKMIAVIVAPIVNAIKFVQMFGVVLAGLGFPVTAVVAGITALVAGGVLLLQNWDTVKAKAFEVWFAIGEIVAMAVENVKSYFGGIGEWFGGAWESVKTAVSTKIGELKQAFWQWLAGMPAPVQEMVANIISIFDGMAMMWDGLKTSAQSAWQWVKDTANSTAQEIATAWQSFAGGLSEVWSDIKNEAKTTWDSTASAVQSAINAIKPIISSIVAFTSSAWQGLSTVAGGVWTGIKAVFASAVNAIKSILTAGLTVFASVFNAGFGLIKNAVATAFNAIKALVRGDMQGVANAIRTGLTNAVGIIRSMVGNIVGAFKNLNSQLLQAGRDAIQGFINGVKGKMSEALTIARQMASQVVSTVKSALDIHSPSRVMRELGAWAGEGFVLGVGDKVKDAKQVAQNLANALTSTVQELHRQNFMLTNHANPLAEWDYKLQFGELAGLTDAQKARVRELAQANLDLVKTNEVNKAISDNIANVNGKIAEINERILLTGKSELEVLQYQLDHAKEYQGVSDEIKQTYLERTRALQDEIKANERLNALQKARDDFAKQQFINQNPHDKYAGQRFDLQKQGFSGGQIDEMVGYQAKTDAFSAFQNLQNALRQNMPKNPMADLQAQFDERLAIIKQARESELGVHAEFDQAEIELSRQFLQAKNELMITQSESLFGSMAQSAKTAFGEQSKVYRAIFTLEKGMAIARSVMAIQTAMAQASANPFPMNLGAMATVASQVANIIGNIRAVTMPIGQAHDGIMSVPKSGTWNLEKGERVLPKHTAQNLDNTLNRLQGNGGGQVINISVTVNNDGGDVQSSHELGKGLGNAIKLAVQAELQKERRQGGLLYGR